MGEDELMAEEKALMMGEDQMEAKFEEEIAQTDGVKWLKELEF